MCALAPPADAADPRPTVALAEDDEVHAELLRVCLEVHGFDGAALLEWARGGAEAGAFLLDVGMPELDGVETCRALRALPGHARTPVLSPGTPTSSAASPSGSGCAFRRCNCWSQESASPLKCE